MESPIAQLAAIAQAGNWERWVVAAAFVVVTAVVASVVSKLINKLMSHDGVSMPSSSIFVNIARAAIWLLGLSMMLSTCFSVDVTALVAALGVGGIAVSLGFRDTISNFIGGLQVSLMRIVVPGDNIRVGTLQGVVQDVTWRQTVIKNIDGHLIVIPNAVINAGTVEKLAPAEKAFLTISMATDGRDLQDIAREIEAAALPAAKTAGAVVTEPKMRFTEITDYSIKGVLSYEMAEVSEIIVANDAIIKAIAPFTRPAASAADDAGAGAESGVAALPSDEGADAGAEPDSPAKPAAK